jgi:hypothetical protein
MTGGDEGGGAERLEPGAETAGVVEEQLGVLDRVVVATTGVIHEGESIPASHRDATRPGWSETACRDAAPFMSYSGCSRRHVLVLPRGIRLQRVAVSSDTSGARPVRADGLVGSRARAQPPGGFNGIDELIDAA